MIDILERATGFVLDCDGTLLDSMGQWIIVEDDLIDATGLDFSTEMMDEIRSAPITEACRIFHERYGLGESTEEVEEFLDGNLLNFYRNEVEPLPGTKEFLEEADRLGIPCSVVSSSPTRYVAAGLSRNGMLDLVSEIFSTEEVGIPKSDTKIFEMAIAHMGSEVESTWGADDSLYAVKVMKSMGMKTIGAYDNDSSGSIAELGSVCDIVVRSFEELLG
ncbi:MAG: HAD family hydrolase [Coriobacteriales bacterium]